MKIDTFLSLLRILVINDTVKKTRLTFKISKTLSTTKINIQLSNVFLYITFEYNVNINLFKVSIVTHGVYTLKEFR